MIHNDRIDVDFLNNIHTFVIVLHATFRKKTSLFYFWSTNLHKQTLKNIWEKKSTVNYLDVSNLYSMYKYAIRHMHSFDSKFVKTIIPQSHVRHPPQCEHI